MFYNKKNDIFGIDLSSELLNKNESLIIDKSVILGVYIRIYKKDKYGKINNLIN